MPVSVEESGPLFLSLFFCPRAPRRAVNENGPVLLHDRRRRDRRRYRLRLLACLATSLLLLVATVRLWPAPREGDAETSQSAAPEIGARQLRIPEPNYTEAARSGDVRAQVEMEVTIAPSGRVPSLRAGASRTRASCGACCFPPKTGAARSAPSRRWATGRRKRPSTRPGARFSAPRGPAARPSRAARRSHSPSGRAVERESVRYGCIGMFVCVWVK